MALKWYARYVIEDVAIVCEKMRKEGKWYIQDGDGLYRHDEKGLEAMVQAELKAPQDLSLRNEIRFEYGSTVQPPYGKWSLCWQFRNFRSCSVGAIMASSPSASMGSNKDCYLTVLYSSRHAVDMNVNSRLVEANESTVGPGSFDPPWELTRRSSPAAAFSKEKRFGDAREEEDDEGGGGSSSAEPVGDREEYLQSRQVETAKRREAVRLAKRSVSARNLAAANEQRLASAANNEVIDGRKGRRQKEKEEEEKRRREEEERRRREEEEEAREREEARQRKGKGGKGKKK